MKGFFNLCVIGSALALSACGGSSDSSSYTGTKTLGNGNKYTCSSEAAFSSCSDDATCTASCTLTSGSVKPIESPSGDNACETDGNNVFGVNGTSCLVSVPSLNSGELSTVDCLSNGTLIINNGFTVSNGSFTLNDYTFTCR